MQISDDMTYYNFSILQVIDNVEHLDSNLVEIYINELKGNCINVKLSDTELNKYRYNPDLLAYDLYGSVQLDFVILLVNDIYDPKEFIKKNIVLPYSSTLSSFLNAVYSKENEYIQQNRADNNIIS
jgi:hypothetical protein